MLYCICFTASFHHLASYGCAKNHGICFFSTLLFSDDDPRYSTNAFAYIKVSFVIELLPCGGDVREHWELKRHSRSRPISNRNQTEENSI